MIELDDQERAFLSQLAVAVDMSLSRLTQAQKAIESSTEMFQVGWRLVLHSRGFDPDLYQARWDGSSVVIDLVEPALDGVSSAQ